ncbi:Mor transcription activator family protein [Acinetobacter pollinis]|uniref:Mor transcription activator family protein n=1 Tax=Acinetobacter pollinis TaxID=2605270 RepID=UPI0018A333E0|nr:Mor transcription activator family protein [Acinetobacter pollinis]MBF7689598.1 hypothetical protein [Acinetobacter pollinis]MBF7698217.1 hypothetical protein [Acinetobacter pollinis]
MQSSSINKLPETLRLIVQLTDYRTALALSSEFGGSEYKFPRSTNVTESHELAEFIGFNNLKKLAQFWNGEMVYIPKPDRYINYLRDERIKQELRELGGKPKLNKELAKKYKVTERWIREIKRKMHDVEQQKKDDDQLSLFEA